MTKQLAYEEAERIDRAINRILSESPIETQTKTQLYAYLLFTRTVKSSLDIIESTVKSHLECNAIENLIQGIERL